MSGLSEKQIADALRHLSNREKEELYDLMQQHKKAVVKKKAQREFLPFVQHMWPGFVHGRHHEIMADAFERIARGELKRLTISLAPRHTKSEFGSHLFPAWFMGLDPTKKIIQCSNTADLATDFGRKVRDTIMSPEYQELFPNTTLAADAAASGKWKTSKKGEYFAIGTGGRVTGRGGDLIIIDDPHSEQEARQAESNPEIFDDVYRWYTSGPRQRVQPGAALVIIATRWSKRDLIGQVLKAAEERDGEKWEVIELPAVLPSGKTLWPEYWPPEEIFALRDELPVSKWLAQYQQTPTSEEGALIKREWWQKWEGKPPACKFIMQSWDTAFMAHERADYSACTTWGVFEKEHPETGKKMDMIILLDAFRERMEFPRLKKVVMESYYQWEPDSVIVEKRASGQSLIQELRTTGIPVSEFTPTRGNDKIARVNAVSDIFASGMVYTPERRWADEVINEVAEFPSGEHDDYVDTVTQALLRFRQGGFVRTLSDEEREDMAVLRATRREYY